MAKKERKLTKRRGGRKDAKLKLRGSRGRPRRAPGLTKLRSVRLDDESYMALRCEFGSLGDALYYLFQGLKEFRKAHGLKTPRKPFQMGPNYRARYLNKDEILLLINTLEEHVREWCFDGEELRTFNALITKLNSALDGRTYRGLPK